MMASAVLVYDGRIVCDVQAAARSAHLHPDVEVPRLRGLFARWRELPSSDPFHEELLYECFQRSREAVHRRARLELAAERRLDGAPRVQAHPALSAEPLCRRDPR
jgi:hypothetical protein